MDLELAEETLELAFDDDIFLKASQQFEAMEKADVVDVKASQEDESVELAFDDDLLLKASQQYEAMDSDIIDDDLLVKASQQYEANTRRFADPVTSDVLDGIRKSAIPEKTKQSTSWSLNVWKEWSKERNAIPFTEELEKEHHLLEQFTDLAVESKQFWLPKFIVEVKKCNGENYSAESVYGLCCGLQRSIKENDEAVNIFSDDGFGLFRQVLDGRMKQLKASGESVKKSAQVITEEVEDQLWERGVLGDMSPQVLLDTMFYYIGLYFALRGGEEHRRLRHKPCQIVLYEPPVGLRYLKYTEDKSKTNQGGLLHRNRAPKSVTHYENKSNPKRCLVQLFKNYNSRCPSDRPDGAFYLKPLKRPKGNIWYQRSAVGHNILSKMISRIMSSGNISGKYTNHSLRSTATSRLFNAHIDEQLIMARTGHSSTTGVRSYKRASEQLIEETSDVLNGKKRKVDVELVAVDADRICPEVASSTAQIASMRQIASVAQSEQTMPQLGLFNISSSSVTFNVNYNPKM